MKKRWVAGVLAVTIITGNVSGVSTYAAGSNGSSKEEVIYIITDAAGNVENVNAVNIFGKGSVTDYGTYRSVKMLNTTDAIQKKNDTITFTTDKDKVYYQGTLEDAQIPWVINITYSLDGKDISPEKLAGKSGALRIHIQIAKNENCTADFYDSYALQAALLLDTENCKNINADGATLANVGADKQISYTVLPGKGLDAVVTADVTDFEMDAVTINGVRMNLKIEIDDAELMDKVTQIQDASKDINDGAAEVSDGTEALLDGGNSLSDGTASLQSGAVSLEDGISTLQDGVTQMQAALQALYDRSGSLTKGSSQMYDALKIIQRELSNVSVTTEQLEKLTQSSAAIRQGITDIYNGAQNLQKSISYESYQAAMQQGGLDVAQLQDKNAQAIQSLSGQIEELSAQLAQLKSIPGYESNEVYAAQTQQLEAQISQLGNIVALLQGNQAAVNGTSQYLDAVSAGVSELVTGLEQLKSQYETFDKAILTFADTLSDMAVKLSTLKGGIDQLVESYGSLDTGIQNYTDGVAAIVAAYAKLVDGTGTLADGGKELVKGSADLKAGAGELYQGMVSLNDGTSRLSDGTNEFYEQTDGMDSKIENTMDDMLDSISGGSSDTVSFVSDKNQNVESVQFVIKTSSIKKPEVEQKETAKQEKLSFWEKLLRLFGWD